MAPSSIAPRFEWTPFSHGYVFWEYPEREHLPPTDEAGQTEWLEGFLQAHADHPDDPLDYEGGEGAREALRRTLAGQCDVDALLALLERMLIEWREAGAFRRMRR